MLDLLEWYVLCAAQGQDTCHALDSYECIEVEDMLVGWPPLSKRCAQQR